MKNLNCNGCVAVETIRKKFGTYKSCLNIVVENPTTQVTSKSIYKGNHLEMQQGIDSLIGQLVMQLTLSKTILTRDPLYILINIASENPISQVTSKSIYKGNHLETQQGIDSLIGQLVMQLTLDCIPNCSISDRLIETS